MNNAYEVEVRRAKLALQRGDFEITYFHLERAHVLAQRMTGRHTYTHALMLVAGLRRGDIREVVGQVPRMVASVLFSRLWLPYESSRRFQIRERKHAIR